MGIWYHGTTKQNAQSILKNGFKKHTYFTWDLAAALTMGGDYVFAVFFPGKDTSTYWEIITTRKILPSKILHCYKFKSEEVFVNSKAILETGKIEEFKKIYGKNISLCKSCKGTGEQGIKKVLQYLPRKMQGGYGKACVSCSGFGYLRKNGKKLNIAK